MKKYNSLMIICLALTLVALCLFALPTQAEAAVVDSGTCRENLTWTLDDAGTLTISGTGAMWDFGTGGPSGNPSHWGADIKVVIIRDGVTSIGDNSFYNCINLTSLTIGKDVEVIGENALAESSSVGGIWVSANNTHYSNDDSGVFFDKNKTVLLQAPGILSGSYAVPDTVMTIGDSAFSDCDSLTAVTIGNGVITIGNRAFDNCDNLRSVPSATVLPRSVSAHFLAATV